MERQTAMSEAVVGRAGALLIPTIWGPGYNTYIAFIPVTERG